MTIYKPDIVLPGHSANALTTVFCDKCGKKVKWSECAGFRAIESFHIADMASGRQVGIPERHLCEICFRRFAKALCEISDGQKSLSLEKKASN